MKKYNYYKVTDRTGRWKIIKARTLVQARMSAVAENGRGNTKAVEAATANDLKYYVEHFGEPDFAS